MACRGGDAGAGGRGRGPAVHLAHSGMGNIPPPQQPAQSHRWGRSSGTQAQGPLPGRSGGSNGIARANKTKQGARKYNKIRKSAAPLRTLGKQETTALVNNSESRVYIPACVKQHPHGFRPFRWGGHRTLASRGARLMTRILEHLAWLRSWGMESVTII